MENGAFKGGVFMIRKMKSEDKAEVMRMMRFFYLSPAVSTNGSDEIFERDIEACLSDDDSLEGFVFEIDEELAGYAMLARGFCTELGRKCVWLEDLFVIPEFRRKGFADDFLGYIKENYRDCAVRLEVEKANKPANALYKKYGFKSFPYNELYLEI